MVEQLENLQLQESAGDVPGATPMQAEVYTGMPVQTLAERAANQTWQNDEIVRAGNVPNLLLRDDTGSSASVAGAGQTRQLADGTKFEYEPGPNGSPRVKQITPPDGKPTTFEYAPDGGLHAINHPRLGRIVQGNNATRIMAADEEGRWVIDRGKDFVTLEPNGTVQIYDKIPSESAAHLTGAISRDATERTFQRGADGKIKSASIGNQQFDTTDGELTADAEGNLTVKGAKQTNRYNLDGSRSITRRDASGNPGEQLHRDADEKGGKWWRTYLDPQGNPVPDAKGNPGTEEVTNVKEIKNGYTFTDKNNAQITQWPGGERDVVSPDGRITKYDAKGSLWLYERPSDDGGTERFQRTGDAWTHTVGGTTEAIGGFSLGDNGTIFYTRSINNNNRAPEGADQVAEAQGLKHEPVSRDGELVHRYYLEGRDNNEIEILATDKSPEQVKEQLEQLRQQKLTELESTFNIKIGREGETSAENKSVPLRTPSLGELATMERVLYKAQPSTINEATGEPLRIEFNGSLDQTGCGGGYLPLGGKPNILIGQPADPSKRDNEDLERVLHHELAHNGQFNVTRDEKSAWDSYAAGLGFTEAEAEGPLDAKGNRPKMWMIEGRDGKQYSFQVVGKDEKGSDRRGWIEVQKNPSGLYERVPGSDEVSTQTVRSLAKVTPVSDYFPYPGEMGAESMVYYRRDAKSRGDLLFENPQLYDVAKNLDQVEIDRHFGAGNYIRSSDGVLVQATPENIQAVAQFEATHRR